MAPFLNSEVWSEFFRQLERSCADAMATVEFNARGRERQPASKPRRLRAIRYDARRDVVELSAGGDVDLAPAVRYFIRSPRRVTVEEIAAGSRILIEDGAQGVTEIAIDGSSEQQASRAATELGRRFSRDLPASPAPSGRSIVDRLAMRRHANAGAD
ncbi:MAG TPA: hypothetical protein VMB91_04075 [Solirubrobacteraceae bacterium]|nr:hypothetical protein [Solirubrobacteraceae bacterium]